MLGMRGAYSFFDHAADVGVRVSAASREELFAAAGIALMEWIGPVPPGAPGADEPVHLDAGDPEQLLVLWLQELLYRFHERHSYFRGATSIVMGEASLSAQTVSVRWDAASQASFQEVKAVTYHKLRVAESNGGWSATVILDI